MHDMRTSFSVALAAEHGRPSGCLPCFGQFGALKALSRRVTAGVMCDRIRQRTHTYEQAGHQPSSATRRVHSVDGATFTAARSRSRAQVWFDGLSGWRQTLCTSSMSCSGIVVRGRPGRSNCRREPGRFSTRPPIPSSLHGTNWCTQLQHSLQKHSGTRDFLQCAFSASFVWFMRAAGHALPVQSRSGERVPEIARPDRVAVPQIR